MPKRTVKKVQSPLERVLWLNERAFRAADEEIKRVQRDADAQIARIRQRIARRRVIYDALKRGTLKP